MDVTIGCGVVNPSKRTPIIITTASTGNITHALRFTLPIAQQAYTYPGNHLGTSTNTTTVPYGTRFRLKASFSETPYTGSALTIVRAFKKYGLIFADQGSSMCVTGTTDSNWQDALNQYGSNPIPGAEFEAVQSPFPIVRDFTPAGTPNCNGVTQNVDPNWQPSPDNETCSNPPPYQPLTTEHINDSIMVVPSLVLLASWMLASIYLFV